MPDPLVGVIVPLFQSERTIEAALRSLQGQSLVAWRAVVVNDGSTDGGPAVARRVGTGDPRIEVVDQENRGLAGARNTGLALAREPYVAFLDADDMLYPDALGSLLEAAQATGLGAACCGYAFLDEAARPIGRQTAASCEVVGIDELLEWNRFVVHSQVIRRDLLANERFDESIGFAEDYDLWLRLAERGVRWAGVDRFAAGYRIRPASISKDFRRMAASEAAMLRRSFERMRRRHPDGRPGEVDRSIARERRVITHAALSYATRAALGPIGGLEEGLDLFADLREKHPLSPGGVAGASVFAIQFGSAQGPEIVVREPRVWAPRLDRWWHALASRGWADEPDGARFARRTLREFAARSIHPRAVAGAAIARALDSGEPIVAPLDVRARWLGRVGSEEGVSVVFVCAEALGSFARPWHDLGEGSSCVASLEDAGGPDGRRVIVVAAPGAGAPGISTPPGAISWERVRASLAEDAWKELRRSWDGWSHDEPEPRHR